MASPEIRIHASDHAPTLVALIPALIALNLVSGQVVAFLKLPIYLDSIGILMCAILLGPVWAAIVGVLTAIIGGLVVNPTLPWYSGTGLCIGLAGGLLAKIGGFRTLPRTVLSGAVIGFVAGTVSAPVTAYLFGGVTFSGADAITAFFRITGKSLITSSFLSGLASDPVDKIAAALLATYFLKLLPSRILDRFPKSKSALRKS